MKKLFGELMHTSASVLIWRGVLMLLLGGCFLLSPLGAVLAVTRLVGALIALYGVYGIISAFRIRGDARWMFALLSFVFMLFGMWVCSNPAGLTAVCTVFLGVWMFVNGIGMLFSPDCRHPFACFSGVFSLIAGICCIAMPLLGIAWAGWLFGLLLAVSGVAMLVSGVNLRRVADALKTDAER